MITAGFIIDFCIDDVGILDKPVHVLEELDIAACASSLENAILRKLYTEVKSAPVSQTVAYLSRKTLRALRLTSQ